MFCSGTNYRCLWTGPKVGPTKTFFRVFSCSSNVGFVPVSDLLVMYSSIWRDVFSSPKIKIWLESFRRPQISQNISCFGRSVTLIIDNRRIDNVCLRISRKLNIECLVWYALSILTFCISLLLRGSLTFAKKNMAGKLFFAFAKIRVPLVCTYVHCTKWSRNISLIHVKVR
jgi:hypothetical protein